MYIFRYGDGDRKEFNIFSPTFTSVFLDFFHVLFRPQPELETDHGSDADWQAFEEMIHYLKICNRRRLNDVLYYRRVKVCYRQRRVKIEKCLA